LMLSAPSGNGRGAFISAVFVDMLPRAILSLNVHRSLVRSTLYGADCCGCLVGLFWWRGVTPAAGALL
jgi:hypothetical protein